MKAGVRITMLGALCLLAAGAACTDDRTSAGDRPSRPDPPAIAPFSLRAAYVAAVQARAPREYDFEPTALGYRTPRAATRMHAELHEGGVEVLSSAEGWVFHPAATRWGCEGALSAVAPVTMGGNPPYPPAQPARPEADGNRVTYRHAGLDEWYVNGPLGLEQGFTLPRSTACAGRVTIELDGGLDAQVSPQGTSAVLRDAAGQEALRYTDLHVVDAAGTELWAKLVATDGRLVIQIDAGAAVYPITVDPLMWVQKDELMAGNATGSDWFGAAIAMNATTAIIAAQNHAGHGAAYVFVPSGSTWALQQELTATDAAMGDQLSAVALSGDTALLGVVSSSTGLGTAYVFVRSGMTWTQQQKLVGDDSYAGDDFGITVAVDGDTAIVGAPRQGPMPGNARGAAYVFTRSNNTWSQVQKLTANDAANNDKFGGRVALNADKALIAAPQKPDPGGSGVVYAFTRSGSTWSQAQKLVGDGSAVAFGQSVAMTSDTAVIGAPSSFNNQGAAYVFSYLFSSWGQQGILTASDAVNFDALGMSVAVDGNTAIVGAQNADNTKGKAYVFMRSGQSWSQQQVLTANNATAGDYFGWSVAVSATTAFVGANQKVLTGGSAYVFALETTGAGGADGGTASSSSTTSSSSGTTSTSSSTSSSSSASSTSGTGGTGGAGSSSSGAGGAGGSPSTSSSSTSSSGGGAGGRPGTTTASGGGGGHGGSGGNGKSEETIDLSCDVGGAGDAGASRAAWLAALALAGLVRRRARGSRS